MMRDFRQMFSESNLLLKLGNTICLRFCIYLYCLVASFNKTLFDATNNPACIVFINAVYQYFHVSCYL